MKYFEKNNYFNFIQLKSYNIKLTHILKKRIFFLFLNFKLKIEKKIQTFGILKNNISSYQFLNIIKESRQKHINVN